jgi:D-alanyl-D-alanine carboxypeptidase/D-alanyl-D-alanine-endopeptidase (penicillin-binding protein 4)
LRRILLHTLLCLAALPAFAQTGVEEVLKSYQADKDLQHAQISFCIIDAASGKTMKEYNSEMAMIPASTLKIVTTSAALGILGKNYTYKTGFYLTEKPDSISGIYQGDLLIKGSGDPSFSSSYFYSSDSLFLTTLIKKIKAKGIKEIKGTVKTDASCFDNSIPGTWIWSDIGNYFGAGANSLSYSDNKFSLYFSSAEAGSFAKLEKVKPDYFAKTVSLQSTVKAYGTEDDAFVYGDPNAYARKVSGTIPPNQKNYEVEAQMPEPPLYFGYSLIAELNKNGMLLNKDSKPLMTETAGEYAYKPALLCYTHVSPTLEKIIFYTNTKSNNHYAESLLKTIGAVKSGKQGTTGNGISAIETFWKERGVDVSGLRMSDGSGLSRANTVTTKLQATILSKIFRDSLMYPAFNASLPVAGKNGSMTSLCKGTFAENNMRAKTGYINRARGYCGYVKTKSGKDLAFSVLFNNYDCSPKEAKLKIEKLLVALVDL